MLLTAGWIGAGQTPLTFWGCGGVSRRSAAFWDRCHLPEGYSLAAGMFPHWLHPSACTREMLGLQSAFPLLLCPCADECCRVFTAATKSWEAAWCKTPVKVMISSLHEEAGWFMSRSVVFGSAVFVWSLKRAARNHRITSFTVRISSWCHGELK